MSNRVLEKCIQNNIALYALHTNLDNHQEGVNKEIMTRIGIEDPKILMPKTNMLSKLIVYVPKEDIDTLDEAVFAEGAGSIGNYSECSFRTNGEGSFRPNENANPVIGNKGNREFVEEIKVEYLIRNTNLRAILNAMWKAHPYEQVAYEVIPIQNKNPEIGSGMWGTLKKDISEVDF